MFYQRFPSIREVLRNAANAEPVGMHSSAADGFNDIEYFFPVGKHVKYRRQLTQVLGKSSEPNKMTGNAEKFAQHNADHFCTIRHYDSGKFFHCQQVSKIIHHATEIIYSVGIWNVGMPALALTHFFCAAMMKTNFRNGFNNIFTIQLKNNA